VTLRRLVLSILIAMVWYWFWRAVGHFASSVVVRTKRRRIYQKYMKEYMTKSANKVKTRYYSADHRNTAKREIERLLDPIPRPDILSDRTLKEYLLNQFCKERNGLGVWELVVGGLKSFAYYSVFVVWMWKLFKVSKVDAGRLERQGVVEEEVEEEEKGSS
jgi:hypothetical protein